MMLFLQPLLLLLCYQFNAARGCSFIVTNFNASSDDLDKANYYIQFRGPDATNKELINDWTFLHNLLSMTGTPTLQPFSDDNVVALFNGEIYNYLDLAEQLSNGNNNKQYVFIGRPCFNTCIHGMGPGFYQTSSWRIRNRIS